MGSRPYPNTLSRTVGVNLKKKQPEIVIGARCSYYKCAREAYDISLGGLTPLCWMGLCMCIDHWSDKRDADIKCSKPKYKYVYDLRSDTEHDVSVAHCTSADQPFERYCLAGRPIYYRMRQFTNTVLHRNWEEKMKIRNL